jgi:hypothetical protein
MNDDNAKYTRLKSVAKALKRSGNPIGAKLFRKKVRDLIKNGNIDERAIKASSYL